MPACVSECLLSSVTYFYSFVFFSDWQRPLRLGAFVSSWPSVSFS